MTTATRKAVIEMKKRGYDNLAIIQIARGAQHFERLYFNWNASMADALQVYVAETPNYRRCAFCEGKHHVQQCHVIAAIMADIPSFVSRFKKVEA